MGYALCAFAFALCWHRGRRSLVNGLGCVIAIGYVYGLVRAQLPGASTYLLFDAAVGGLYVAWLPRILRDNSPRWRVVRPWLVVLMGWPTLLLLAPVQHPLVQLVGWRAAAYFVPFLYLGTQLNGERVRSLARWIAVLNLVAFAFAAAEYTWGIEPFYPLGPTTFMVHYCRDVAGGAHRLPATFSSSHAYAGVMVLTLPWLVEAWLDRSRRERLRWLFPVALLATVLGVLMAASRSAAIVLGTLVLFLVCTRQLGTVRWIGLAGMLTVVGLLMANEERLQRVMTLSDTRYVELRLRSSVRWSFWELAGTYPMGNGLGGGGTNLPHFLSALAVEPIGEQLENEYARIMLEQGLIGLIAWGAFIGWVFTRFIDLDRGRFLPRELGERMLWVALAASYATGIIGMGLLMAMPGAMLLFLGTGRLVANSVGGLDRRSVPATPVRRQGRRTRQVVVEHADA